VSNLKDIVSSNQKQYNLGTKFSKYENFIPNDGEFLEPLSNNLPLGINMDNFFVDGWTYSDFAGDIGVYLTSSTLPVSNPSYFKTAVFPGSSLNFDSNVDAVTPDKLRVKSPSLFKNATLFNYANTQLFHSKFSGFVLNNTNIEVLRNRYYTTEIDIHSYTYSRAIYTLTDGVTTTSQLVASSSNFELEIIKGENELNNPNPIKKHYFFNRNNLNLTLKSNSYAFYTNTNPWNLGLPTPPSTENSFEIVFNNISFVEVDMIPFFKYWFSTGSIDNRVKTPYFAVAPFIDYTNANFDFIGNVTITIDSDTIVGQNISTVIIGSGGVNGSISNTTGGLVTGLAQAVPPRNSGSLFP
jgi:hypothetical protein